MHADNVIFFIFSGLSLCDSFSRRIDFILTFYKMAIDSPVYVHKHVEHNAFNVKKKKFKFKHSSWNIDIIRMLFSSYVLSLF